MENENQNLANEPAPANNEPAPAPPQAGSPVIPVQSTQNTYSESAPDPAAPAPAPVVPVSPAPAPATTPAPMMPAPEVSKSKKKALVFITAGVMVLVLAAAALLYFFVFSKHISAKDVSSAQSEANSLNSDVSSINGFLSSNNTPSSTSELDSQLSSAQNKLTDAEKQYALLQKSNVLKDKTTDQKFKSLETKWEPYDTYVTNDLKDANAIFPPLYKFIDQVTALAKNAPTTVAQLNTYLANFKTYTSTALSGLTGVHAVLPENQQGLTAITSYLTTVSLDLSSAQKDIQAGNDVAAETALNDIDSNQSSLDKALNSVDTKSTNHENQVDPSAQISSFQSALDNLQTQLGYK